jgi:type I restriction enzyme S subunit
MDDLDVSDLVWLDGVNSSQREKFAASQGWVLMVGSNGNPERIGNCVLISEPSDFLFASFLVGLKPFPQKVNERFLLLRLRAEDIRTLLRVTVRGSTGLQNINIPALAGFEIDLPELVEQRRIADILDTLDERIRKTAHIITKLKLVKHGLLNSLLTRGIDEHGLLRDPARHPEQFADTQLGRLPKQWDVAPIGDLLAEVEPAMRSGPFGSALLKHELVSSGVPLLGIDNVHVDNFKAEFTRFVTPQKARELSRYRVQPDDVMITIMGTVGRSCLVPEDAPLALSSKHVWTMTFDQRRYLPYLVSAQLNHAAWVLAQLRRDEQGGIMNAIRSDTLRETTLPVPPIDEQDHIKAVLESQDQRIAREEEKLGKLRLLKQGLCFDLLTGGIRVPMEAVS